MPRKALVTFDFPSAPTVGGATTWYVTPTGTNASGTWGISVTGSSASTTGNAGTATTLQTARTITVGSTGRSFNGSADISWSLADIGAATSTHTHGLVRHSLAAPALIDGLTNSNFRTTLFGSTTSGYQLSTARWDTSPSVLGLSAYSTMFAWAGADTHGFLAVNYNTAGVRIGGGNGDTINWSKTLAFGDGTGASGNWGINITGSSASTTGNAGTATTLQTARTINGVSFNGSANITITANTPNTLTIGTYLTGNNFNGSAATTWAVDATTTATASKIVARNSSGDDFRRYGFAEYFNMSHGASGATTDTVFYSSGDDYIRKNNATGFRASLNVPTRTGGDASGNWGISITGNAATVTNGVYTTGNQTIDGNKTFSGTTALAAASTVDGDAIGYRHVPVTVSNAATNIAQTHNGKAIGKDDTTAYTYSIPDGLDIGTIITVFNNAASGNITVAMTGSEVMRLAGTTSTGSRTVGPYGEGTFHKVSATTWLSAGPAVS
jgi:hypothetical protein